MRVRASRECFNGLGKVSKDFYEWWDKTRGENVWMGVLIAIGVILLFIFILLPAALALLIIAGVLFLSAVIIDGIYGKDTAGTAPAATPAAEAATPATDASEKV